MNFKKYADLLTNYSLEIQPGERLLVRTTVQAEPLIKELYRAVYKAGGHMEVMLEIEGRQRIFMEEANGAQLDYVSPFLDYALRNFEAYLVIKAPYNLASGRGFPSEKVKQAKKAKQPLMKVYSERTATRDLKRSLCVFPCNALAQMAGMSLVDYTDFVFKACKLDAENPREAWLEVRKNQQHIVDHLNSKNSVRYVNELGTDIRFSTEGRTWINSDGQTNMPSGEVYTSPVEDSVNGVIHFNFPSVYMGTEVRDVRLEVKEGEVVNWSAKNGQEVLDQVFKIPGANRFGEAAIGTNYGIQKITKNILFDEKMGGTVHMAIGQSYLQAGGKNTSSVHWDMISEMRNGGEIFADDELIYKDGKFIF